MDAEAEAPQSLDAAVDAAFAAHAEPPPEAPAPVEAAPEAPDAPEGDEAKAERARDESGRFAAKEALEKAEKAPTKAPAVRRGGPPPAPAVAAPVTPVPEMKAPRLWRNEEAKKAWATVPEPVRVEVLRREKELDRALESTAEDRKFATTLRQTMAPFEAQIRAEGSTPEKAIGTLLNTAQLLRTGPPALKADAMAGTLLDFGVPLDLLVQALERRMQGQPAQAAQGAAPQHIDPAAIAAQVRESLMQEMQQRSESVAVQQATGEVESFLQGKVLHGPDGSDYTDDLRADMADIIERAAARGRDISLEDAYRRAAAEHPEVSRVLEQRQRAQAATQANATVKRSLRAASSVRSSPAVAPPASRGTSSLSDAVDAAFDAYSGRG